MGGLQFPLHCHFVQLNINPVYKEILVFIHEMHSPEQYKGIIWNNRYFQIGGKTLFNKNWFAKGMMYIKDLLNDEKMQSYLLKPYGRSSVSKLWTFYTTMD